VRPILYVLRFRKWKGNDFEFWHPMRTDIVCTVSVCLIFLDIKLKRMVFFHHNQFSSNSSHMPSNYSILKCLPLRHKCINFHLKWCSVIIVFDKLCIISIVSIRSLLSALCLPPQTITRSLTRVSMLMVSRPINFYIYRTIMCVCVRACVRAYALVNDDDKESDL